MFHQKFFKLNIVQNNTLADFLKLFTKAKYVFFDTETTGLAVRWKGKDYVVGYTFAFEDDISKDVFYVPVRHVFEGVYKDSSRFAGFKESFLKLFPDFCPEKFEGTYYNVDAYDFSQKLKALMENGHRTYIAHNISYDLHTIANEGIDIVRFFDVNDIEDTQIMVHTIDETAEKNLESVTKQMYSVEKSHYSDTIKTVTKEEKISQGLKATVNASFPLVQIPIGAQYSAEDVWFMKQMFPTLQDWVNKEGQEELYHKARIPFLKALWKMERKGVRIDLEALDKMQALAETESENFKYRMFKILGAEFNPNSSQHLYEVLFGHKKKLVSLTPEAQAMFDEEAQGLTTAQKTALMKRFKQDRACVRFEPSYNKELVSLNLGFTPTAFTDGGTLKYEELRTPKTGSEELNALLKQNVSPNAKAFIKELIGYKKLSKLISAFMEGLREQIYEDGKVHCSFNICGTDSWRLSSQYPNLQQLPHPLEEPKEGEDRSYYDFWSQFEIRRLFVADEGDVVVAADYHALEKFLTAHLSQDKVLIKMLKDNSDPHGTVATIVFPELADVNPNDVKKIAPDKRQISKAIGFALDYGGGAGTIARKLGIDVRVAQGYVDKYFKGFYGLHTYDKAVVKFAKRNGFVKTIGGHKRHLWDINNADRAISSKAERIAVNVMSQGSGGDVAMFAQIDVDNDPVLNSIGAYMVINVHDEIVMMCPEEYADLCKERLCYHMEHCLEKRGIHLTVPLEAVADTGKSYYEAK